MGRKEILPNGKYCKNDSEFDGDGSDQVIWNSSGRKTEEEKVYTYDEAINLTGNGCYNISLLITLALAALPMAFDMFGFNYVVAAAACDLQLTHKQTSFLLSVPLMGSILSAYVHGYLSDTRGRKKCLTEVLWASFVIASLSALSPNFIVLAILKFFSSSICSGVQSMSYTLIGESCSVHIKDRYVVILSSTLACVFAVFTAQAYIVLGLDFSYDLGFIIFKPWRLLILTLAMGLGFSACFMNYFYESPKYLVSVGRISEAVEILKKIKKRNKENGDYPVKNIILLEESSVQHKEASFLRSLWDQTAPLFTPPLLQRTLLLFYILAALFSLNNGFYVWTPTLISSIFEEPTAANPNATDGFCELISLRPKETNQTIGVGSRATELSFKLELNEPPTIFQDCIAAVKLETLLVGLTEGVVFTTINYAASRMTHRKKATIIFTSVLASTSCIILLFVSEKITTIIFFFGVQLNSIAMGMTFCSIIDLFPTRYRGMITALGVMVARGSALVGVNLVGVYMFTHCTTSLYIWGAYAFSGALIAFLLPPDVTQKS